MVSLIKNPMVVLLILCVSVCCQAQQPLIEPYLMSGKLAEGQSVLKKHLATQPSDDQAKFGLGVLHFMQAVEHLGQSWYQYGINDELANMAFFRLPVADNPNPQQVTYQDVRSVLQTMIDYLDKSDQALSQVSSKEVKLPLHLFQFHLDIDQNGKLTPEEDLTKIYSQYFGDDFAKGQPKLSETIVVFDYADVQWLRGYTHLLRAMCETILAYDEEPLWDVISYRIFKNPEFHFQFMKEEFLEAQQNKDRNDFFWGNRNTILDAVAAIHNLNFRLIEPDRLKRAHQHLKQTVVQSRKMWEAVSSETDDDREWIPNERQSSKVCLTRISKEMLSTWHEFLDEVDAILDGQKLLPFWRGTDENRGVNLHKVFHQPRDLDVILWIHGSAAVPFLERGEVTEQDTWNRFQRVYNGQFFTFAAWFN